jgi:hypothetical protein
VPQTGFPFEWVLGTVFVAVFNALFNPIFWAVMVLVALQYRRIAQMRRSFLGSGRNSIVADTLTATAYGLLGGLIGGYLIVFAGVTLSLDKFPIIPLLTAAILLMLINPRFLCFAYAGGLLAFTHLLVGFPEMIIPQVMALVAVLHFVESVLILLSGHLGAIPSFVRLPRGQIVGGFTLQKFWPIPIVALVLVPGTAAAGASVMPMPEWWPLIKPEVVAEPATMVFAMFTLVAGLGYADVATTRTPSDKSRTSAVYLATYSAVLFVLAVLAGAHGGAWLWAAALFAPLGHELVIQASKMMELNGQPLFVPHPAGVRVLDVVVGSPAWRAGLRSGDVILEINHYPALSRGDLLLLVSQPGLKEISYLQREKHYRRETVHLEAGQPFGVMPVPEGNEQMYLELQGTPPLVRWLTRGRRPVNRRG